MLKITPLPLGLIDAAQVLSDHDVLASIREILDARFAAYPSRQIEHFAEDADQLLSDMIAYLPSDLPSYEDVCADANRRCGTMDLRA